MKSNTKTGVVFDIGSLYDRFQQLADRRQAQGKRYSLATILILIVMAKLSGEDQPSGIADWAEYRTEQLVEMLGLDYKKMPHHSTYRRILAEVIAAEELETMVSAYFTKHQYFGKQVQVSIDGKVLRGTLDEDQNGTYLLAAYLPQEGLVLMEIAIEGKGKEIPGALRLLKMIDLRGKIVIGDALHTQREASITICAEGGDYIWYAKGNQSHMEENIQLWFEPEPDPIPGANHSPKDFEQAQQVNKRHGRIEVRQITVSSQLKDFFDWPYLEQVFMLRRRITSIKTGTVKEKTIYGFTSLSREKTSPDELLSLIRSYWGIENGLHYRRDVTLREDQTRMTKGHMGQVMACINNLVIGLLIGKQRFKYLPSARRYFNVDPARAFALITGL